MINSKHLTARRGGVAGRRGRSSPIAQQQQQQPPQPNRGVQVGVPEGRGPGGAANAPAGRGRGRNPGPPPGPAPRNAEGRVLLSGATPKDKGVWLPGGGGGQTVQARRADSVPAVGESAARRSRPEPARAAHPLQAVGVRASVPDAVRRRVRRAAGDRAHLHLRHRRAAHVPRDLHGRPHASGESAAVVLRPLDRLVGRRHARRRHHRLQRGILDRPSRLTARPRNCTRSRSSPAPTTGRSTTRRSWTIPARTPSRGRTRSICGGKRERSSSSTSASR